MRDRLALAFATLAAVAMAACGHADAPPPQHPAPAAAAPKYDPRELHELADGIYDVLDAMAAIVAGRAADCDAMARDLTALFERSAPLFARAKEIAADPAGGRGLAAEMKQHDAQAPGLVDRIAAGLAPCKDDPALVRAIERMPVF